MVDHTLDRFIFCYSPLCRFSTTRQADLSSISELNNSSLHRHTRIKAAANYILNRVKTVSEVDDSPCRCEGIEKINNSFFFILSSDPFLSFFDFHAKSNNYIATEELCSVRKKHLTVLTSPVPLASISCHLFQSAPSVRPDCLIHHSGEFRVNTFKWTVRRRQVLHSMGRFGYRHNSIKGNW